LELIDKIAHYRGPKHHDAAAVAFVGEGSGYFNEIAASSRVNYALCGKVDGKSGHSNS
jgi:hypothetical protein